MTKTLGPADINDPANKEYHIPPGRYTEQQMADSEARLRREGDILDLDADPHIYYVWAAQCLGLQLLRANGGVAPLPVPEEGSDNKEADPK